MSKWIDADALNDAMYHEAFENDVSYDERNPMARWDSGLWIRYKMFENAIDSAPTIDAVSVVRCKECKWAKANGTYQWCGRLDSTAQITADDFCSRGERKEGE